MGRARTRAGRRRTGLAFLAIAVVSVGAWTVGAPAASGAPVDAWSSEFGGAGNAAANPGEALVTAANAGRLEEAWSSRQTTGSLVAPTVVGGIAYHVDNAANVEVPATLIATSVDTGATLATLSLPAGVAWYHGMTVAGDVAVLPYVGHSRPGGTLAVDLARWAVRWDQPLPPPVQTWQDRSTAGPVLVDDGRVYVAGAGYTVNALRLSDGAPLWRLPSGATVVRGTAAAGGVLYTGGDDGVVAHDGATGRRLWSAPGTGAPVVAGGRVFTSDGVRLVAVPAGGCGAATCAPLWTRDVGAAWSMVVTIGGADASTLFLTWTRDRDQQGVIERRSAATGEVEWSAPTDPYASAPVRGGSTVWLVGNGRRLVGFSATATGDQPLRVIELPADRHGGHQGLAIAGGTVLLGSWPQHLTGYRVPGT